MPHSLTSSLPLRDSQSSGGSGAAPTAPRPSRGSNRADPLTNQVSPLDPLETSSHPRINACDDEHCDCAQYFRNPDSIPFEHRGWQPMRRRVFASMCRTGMPNARKHAFWNCCDNVHVMHNPATGEVDLWPETCHDRFCLPCGQKRSRRIASAIEGLMKAATNKLMFITLTVRGRPADSLRTMIDRLRDAWKELRRLKGWRNTIKGGVVMLEVKWSRTSGGHWHPHYHLICEGTWLEEKWLRDAWALITRDSDQCRVQLVKEHAAALSYVSKYASKPLDPSFVMRPPLIDEAMRTLKGIRLAACFGTWHGTPLSKGVEDAEKDDTEVLTHWAYCGTTRDVAAKAARGDADAKNILAAVERLLTLRHSLAERCRGPTQMHAPTDSAPTSRDAIADGFGTLPLIAAR